MLPVNKTRRLLIRVNVSRHEPVRYTQASRPSPFSIPFNTVLSPRLRIMGDATRRGGVAALVGSGVVAANMVVVMGIAEKPIGGVISLLLVMPEKKFRRRPTTKGVGLCVSDSHTGNHPEDGFTPLKTIQRLLVVIGKSSYSGFEGEAFEPERRVLSWIILEMLIDVACIAGCTLPRGLQNLCCNPRTLVPVKEKEPSEVGLTEEALINPTYPDQLVTIGGNLSKECRAQLKILLNKNMDIFAWEPADMTRVSRRIIKHTFNANLTVEPFCQKMRVLALYRSLAVIKEVEELLKEGIVRPIRYPTWISDPVLVNKVDKSWRMCIDFKNINSACPNDYYPLPDIDRKIKSVMGFRYKCFLDAYKGYHQVQMAKDDEENTAFYTNQAYVDNMVINSSDEKILIADIAKTFDNLRNINMKLNPKKCSFRMEEVKFLGYVVTSEGIWANPKKTKALGDMQSPRTLREVQLIMKYLVNISKRHAFWSLNEDILKINDFDYQYAVSIKEDMAYPCLHSPKDHKGNKLNTQYPEKTNTPYWIYSM
ncbi:hypothetical protein Tco_1221544 [Tanacetum coccineum]